jgi:hypothetical protein
MKVSLLKAGRAACSLNLVTLYTTLKFLQMITNFGLGRLREETAIIRLKKETFLIFVTGEGKKQILDPLINISNTDTHFGG